MGPYQLCTQYYKLINRLVYSVLTRSTGPFKQYKQYQTTTWQRILTYLGLVHI